MPIVDVTVTAGVTYHIAVDGYDGTVGSVTLTMADLGGGMTLPAGAVGIADFVNGGYQWTTAAQNAALVLADPEAVVPGVGLVIGDTTDPIEIIGDFAAYLLAGDWTVVMEWFRQDDFCTVIHIQDIADDNPRLSFDDDKRVGSGFFVYDLVGGNERDTFTLPGANTTHVVDVAAVTRTNAKIVQSFNGAAIQSAVAAQASWAAGVNHVYVGGSVGSNFGNVILGRIVVYPPQSDAALPGLSVASVITIPTTGPSNDNFANAETLSVGSPLVAQNFVYYSDFDVTVNATKESGEPNHAGDAGGQSLWWKFIAPATRTYTVETTGSLDNSSDMLDTTMGVYTGSAVNALTTIASNDDADPTNNIFTSKATLSATSGVTYYIAVDTFSGGSPGPQNFGSIHIKIT
jgi:hypothetical protein